MCSLRSTENRTLSHFVLLILVLLFVVVIIIFLLHDTESTFYPHFLDYFREQGELISFLHE